MDAVLWADFARWARAVPRLASAQAVDLASCYVARHRAAGVDSADAERRIARVQALRTLAPERERLYWDTRYRLGGGPSEPLPLLVDAAAGMSPGRALDVGMGLGRNALYLAGRGWRVTGYDFSREALAGARREATQRGLTLETVTATHATFPYGAARWDLIVMSYADIGALDELWPTRVAEALAPGGVLVFQGSAPAGVTREQVRAHWRGLQVQRLDILPAGEDWLAGGDQPTVKLVARRPRPERR